MLAAYIEAFGSPPKLTIGQIQDPTPKDGEVCIAVEYAGVNPVDAKIAKGLLKSRMPHEFPLILGWEAAGIIHSIGPNVKKWNVGDAVYAYCRKPTIQWGAWAEYVTLPEENVAPIPRNLSTKEAAAIPLAGLTAWQALFEKIRLKPGEAILIHAGGGGVGSYAIQWAKFCGATPILVTASPSKFEYVKKLGAEEVIDYKSKDFVEIIQENHPFGIDVVLDTVGGDTYSRSFEVLKQGGRIVSLLEQPNIEQQKAHQVEAHYLFVSPNGRELKAISDLYEKNRVSLPEIREMGLDQAGLALEEIGNGHTTGKLVLNIKQGLAR